MATISPDSAFKSSSDNIEKLFGTPGVHFYLPAYQRPFSWDVSQVNNLLESITTGIIRLVDDENTYSFVGSVITVPDNDHLSINPLVKTEVPSKVQLIIDGQQRLTTLLLTCLVLHNRISVAKKVFGVNSQHQEVCDWLSDKSSEALLELEGKLGTRQVPYNGHTAFYPRMIRAYDDQWARNKQQEKYASAIANLCHSYLTSGDNTIEFVPQNNSGNDDDDAVKEAITTIQTHIDKFERDFDNNELTSSLPLSLIQASPELLDSVGINTDQNLITKIKAVDIDDEQFGNLLRLVIYSNYLLKRVVIARIVCENESYAFDVFESLNTTGEPLSAFDTFKPPIIKKLGEANYGSAPEKIHLDLISKIINEKKPGEEREKFTKDLVINFALAESGAKLGRRLADQRKQLAIYVKDNQDDSTKRLDLLANFKNVAELTQIKESDGLNFNFSHLTQEDETAIKLSFKFFHDLTHGIVIAPLARFYGQAADSKNKSDLDKFVEAVKACLAFSILWRCKGKAGADGIDGKYRSLMQNSDETPPNYLGMARSLDNLLKTDDLKLRMRELLVGRGITDKTSYLNFASKIEFYKNNKKLTKLILLAAHHDSAVQPDGSLKVGVKSVAEGYLTFEKYTKLDTAHIEHIAPQNRMTGSNWDPNIYNEEGFKHTIGNLTLVTPAINWELGNKDWTHKKVLFSALASQTDKDADRVFADAAINGTTFNDQQEVQNFVLQHTYVSQLVPIAKFIAWNKQTIENRTVNLLGLAYDRLYSWLN